MKHLNVVLVHRVKRLCVITDCMNIAYFPPQGWNFCLVSGHCFILRERECYVSA